MSTSIFHSPFTTALSGSARETEDRIRNIFQYQKKRPPVPALLLACALALSCGGLVSCQAQETGADIPFSNFTALPGEPLDVVIPATSAQDYNDTNIAFLDNLAANGPGTDDLPTTPVNLSDFSQSESWNETVWLLSQDTERDAALYGVIQFDDYTPGLNASDKLYGVIVHSGKHNAYCSLDWSANLWAYEAPELWCGDFDGDGRDELAFALACEHGSQSWVECLYLFEPDTMWDYSPNLRTLETSISTSYDPETLTLYVATDDQLLILDESWVEGAPILEGSLWGGSQVEFYLRDGAIWCTVALVPSEAPLSNPVFVDCPVVFQDGSYIWGAPELSARSLPASAESASGADRLLWITEDGQVMQAATQEEYEAGGTPYGDEDGYLFYRF